eukprot:4813239-Amphidinium_carterae.1
MLFLGQLQRPSTPPTNSKCEEPKLPGDGTNLHWCLSTHATNLIGTSTCCVRSTNPTLKCNLPSVFSASHTAEINFRPGCFCGDWWVTGQGSTRLQRDASHTKGLVQLIAHTLNGEVGIRFRLFDIRSRSLCLQFHTTMITGSAPHQTIRSIIVEEDRVVAHGATPSPEWMILMLPPSPQALLGDCTFRLNLRRGGRSGESLPKWVRIAVVSILDVLEAVKEPMVPSALRQIVALDGGYQSPAHCVVGLLKGLIDVQACDKSCDSKSRSDMVPLVGLHMEVPQQEGRTPFAWGAYSNSHVLTALARMSIWQAYMSKMLMPVAGTAKHCHLRAGSSHGPSPDD